MRHLTDGEATTATPTRPPQLYTGATTCDFRPEWAGLVGDGVPLAEGCFQTQVGDHLPGLVLADWLDERGDERGAWVREFCRWEQFAQVGEFGHQKVVKWNDRQSSFAQYTATEAGWRWVGLWGAVAARWCPDGYGVGPQWETWADVRVRAVNVWCVLWACRLAAWRQTGAAVRDAGAAWSQAYAAGSQGEAAGSHAYAALSQAYAAGSHAYAALSQAYAAGSHAGAALSHAGAAGSQAYAAGSQAVAAGSQAYAAELKCRKWLMGFWAAMAAGCPQC
jgi:uncharacterized protein (TIGR02996 family)